MVVRELCAERPGGANPLTARELEVLHLLVKGATYELIGRTLGIALGTVQAHIKAIYRKLEVATKAEATAEAFKRGLID
jgi:DNA-binding CsgD family transcriptional regulator